MPFPSINTLEFGASVDDLLKTEDNDSPVTADYSSLAQYFTGWYSIEFKLTSDKEGIFSVY